MQVPPNYGRQYSDDFAGLFASVAKAEGAALVPFLLEGIANGRELLQRFGGIRGVSMASAEDIATVEGVSKELAETIYRALH